MEDRKLKKLEKKLEKINCELNKLYKVKEQLEIAAVERLGRLSRLQNEAVKMPKPAGKHKDKCPTCDQKLELKKFTAYHDNYSAYGLHYSCPRCPYEYFGYQTESW